MAMDYGEVQALLKEIPAGAWVALSEEKHAVMAYGNDALRVVKESRANGEAVPYLVRVPEEEMILIL